MHLYKFKSAQERITMHRMSFLFQALVATSLLSLHACADVPATKLPTDDEMKERIRLDNKTWEQASLAYSNCLGAYAEKMFKSPASAGDIADGAAASCSDFAFQSANAEVRERLETSVLYRKGVTADQMERDSRQAPTAEQLQAELAAHNRGATIDYVLKLRAKFGS